ncbi:hypothetical protein PULV_a4039 [Pseudoalteromonas ulvae UL12]|nr:hypothetical protein [Pseudoalteromonas ulvae UL12]
MPIEASTAPSNDNPIKTAIDIKTHFKTILIMIFTDPYR